MLDTKRKVASVTGEINFNESTEELKATGYDGYCSLKWEAWFDVAAFEAVKFLERQGFKYIKNSKIISLEKPCVPLQKQHEERI